MACTGGAGRAPPVQVAGRNLTVAGVPIFIKGIAWNPFAAGQSASLGHVQDFAGFVNIDAPAIAAAGINVVRTYAPITDTSVLDTLWSHGIHVIMTVFYDAGYGDSAVSAAATVCSLKGHQV